LLSVGERGEKSAPRGRFRGDQSRRRFNVRGWGKKQSNLEWAQRREGAKKKHAQSYRGGKSVGGVFPGSKKGRRPVEKKKEGSKRAKEKGRSRIEGGKGADLHLKTRGPLSLAFGKRIWADLAKAGTQVGWDRGGVWILCKSRAKTKNGEGSKYYKTLVVL